MIGYLVVGVLLAGLLMMLLNWWANAEVGAAKRSLMWAIVGLCVLLGVALFAAGRGFMAILPGAFAAWRMFGSARSAANMAGRMGNAFKRPSGTNMERSEALEVLGLKDGASKEEINGAYKRLMAQCHPDKGGSDWMAAQLNEAKKTLLG
jgi:hypothetical protein